MCRYGCKSLFVEVMKKLVYIVFLVLTVYSCRTRTVYMPVETKVLDSVVSMILHFKRS